MNKDIETEIKIDFEDIYTKYSDENITIVLINHNKYSIPIDINIYLPAGIEVKMNNEETGVGWLKRTTVNVDGSSMSSQRLYFKHNDVRYGFADIIIEINHKNDYHMKQSIKLWKMK